MDNKKPVLNRIRQLGELIVSIQEATSRSQRSEHLWWSLIPYLSLRSNKRYNHEILKCHNANHIRDIWTHCPYKVIPRTNGSAKSVQWGFMQVFPTDLHRANKKVVRKMKPKSIRSISHFCVEFLNQFQGVKEPDKDPDTLFDVK